MTRIPLLLAALALGMATGVQAQKALYRSVGPDGSVVFTDRPAWIDPATFDARVRAARLAASDASQPLLPGGLKPHSPEAARAAAAAAASAAKEDDRRSGPPRNLIVQDPGVRERAPVVAAPREFVRAPLPPDPALERAVVLALVLESVVTQLEDTCNRANPKAAARYAVTDTWKQHNLQLLNKTRMVLADSFAGAQRVSINLKVKGEVDSALGPVESFTPAERLQWCEKSAADVRAGLLDLSGKPEIAPPLVAYRLR